MSHTSDKDVSISIYQQVINGHVIACLSILFFLFYFSITKTAPNTYDIHLADSSVFIAVIAVSGIIFASSTVIISKCERMVRRSETPESTAPLGIRVAYAIIAVSFFISLIAGIALGSISITGLQIG